MSVISLYFRTDASVPVSVTGPACDLNCLECLDRRLDLMPAVRTSEELYQEARRRLDAGVNVMEIDGGCDMDGRVPVSYVAEGMRLAHSEGMDFSVRLGFADAGEVRRMMDCGARYFVQHVHQDPDIIRMLGTDRGPEDYRRSIEDILSCGGHVLAHLTVGYGRADFMLSAGLLRDLGVKEAVLDTVVPMPGSCLEESSLTVEAVAECAEHLVKEGFTVCLGHCRDTSLPDMDMACALAGVRRFQSPSLFFLDDLDLGGIVHADSESCVPF